jgi:hypothetical protein
MRKVKFSILWSGRVFTGTIDVSKSDVEQPRFLHHLKSCLMTNGTVLSLDLVEPPNEFQTR